MQTKVHHLKIEPHNGSITLILHYEEYETKHGTEYQILHRVQIGIDHMVDMPIDEYVHLLPHGFITHEEALEWDYDNLEQFLGEVA